ncbi:MAG: FG-GAP-like repeat-containing protein [Planctomycetota bacterium]
MSSSCFYRLGIGVALALSFTTALSAEVRFVAQPPLAVVTPQSMISADMNEDGLPDIVVASVVGHVVSVLLNDGSGSLLAPATFPAGTSPYHLCTADFDEDGHADVAVANLVGGTLQVLLGTGTGALGAPTSFPTGSLSTAITCADFNEDQHQDLVVANHGGASLTLLFGDGGGNFGASVYLTLGGFPSFVTHGDLDGDGHLDLAVSRSLDSNFSLFFGDGSGAFPLSSTHFLGQDDAIWFLSTSDVDGNGSDDLLIPCPNANSVAVFLGLGNGLLAPPAPFATGVYPRAADVQDFDGDGRSDLGIVNGGGGSVSVLLGDGGGSFAAPVNFLSGPEGAHVICADLNLDGRLDLVVGQTAASQLRVLINESTPPNPQPFRRGDVDASGTVQIVDVIVLLHGLFHFAAPAWGCADAVDVNDDGHINLLDPVALLSHLFGNGYVSLPTPSAGACDHDPTIDALSDCRPGLCP